MALWKCHSTNRKRKELMLKRGERKIERRRVFLAAVKTKGFSLSTL